MYLQSENERVRGIPHTVVAPLAVSGESSHFYFRYGVILDLLNHLLYFRLTS